MYSLCLFSRSSASKLVSALSMPSCVSYASVSPAALCSRSAFASAVSSFLVMFSEFRVWCEGCMSRWIWLRALSMAFFVANTISVDTQPSSCIKQASSKSTAVAAALLCMKLSNSASFIPKESVLPASAGWRDTCTSVEKNDKARVLSYVYDSWLSSHPLMWNQKHKFPLGDFLATVWRGRAWHQLIWYSRDTQSSGTNRLKDRAPWHQLWLTGMSPSVIKISHRILKSRDWLFILRIVFEPKAVSTPKRYIGSAKMPGMPGLNFCWRNCRAVNHQSILRNWW